MGLESEKNSEQRIANRVLFRAIRERANERERGVGVCV